MRSLVARAGGGVDDALSAETDSADPSCFECGLALLRVERAVKLVSCVIALRVCACKGATPFRQTAHTASLPVCNSVFQNYGCAHCDNTHRQLEEHQQLTS